MATEKQLAYYARMKAAKSETKSEKHEIVQSDDYTQEWLDALLTTMQIRSVMVPGQVKDCVPVADEVIRLLKERTNA